MLFSHGINSNVTVNVSASCVRAKSSKIELPLYFKPLKIHAFKMYEAEQEEWLTINKHQISIQVNDTQWSDMWYIVRNLTH